MQKANILILCTHAVFLHSHRIKFIQRLRMKGYSVSALLGKHPSNKADEHAQNLLRFEGLDLYIGASKILMHVLFIIINFKKIDKVIYIGVRQIILGSLLLLVKSKSKHVFVFSGLSGMLHSQSWKTQTVVKIIFSFLKLLMWKKDLVAIVQNTHDFDYISKHLKIKHVILVPGSGTDLNLFPKIDFDDKKNQVVFVGRILVDKGVLEFIQAATELKKNYPNWDFKICGGIYTKNRNSISAEHLENILAGTNVSYSGHVDNIHHVLTEAKIMCLPSYHEGFPKAIVDACAAGCAIVTTNVPGCNESIEHGTHGLLVKSKDITALKNALETCICDDAKLREFSFNARALAIKKYSVDEITDQLMYALGA